MKSKWYVVRVGGPGRGTGLKLISGPHKDEATANSSIKDPKEEVWSTVLCNKYGLLSKK